VTDATGSPAFSIFVSLAGLLSIFVSLGGVLIFVLYNRRKKQLEIQKLALEIERLRTESLIYRPTARETWEILEKIGVLAAEKFSLSGGEASLDRITRSRFPLWNCVPSRHIETRVHCPDRRKLWNERPLRAEEIYCRPQPVWKAVVNTHLQGISVRAYGIRGRQRDWPST
jgi:hypothetical protein